MDCWITTRDSRWFRYRAAAIIIEDGVHEYMTWLPINDLHKYKAYPTFFQDKLLNMKNEIEHIVTNEEIDIFREKL